MAAIEKILKDGSAIGSGIALYKLMDKYVDPTYPMPWKVYVPNVEASNTTAFVDFFLSLLIWAKGGLSEVARDWILEHGIAAGASGLIGLWMSPAMYVVSGPNVPAVPGVTSMPVPYAAQYPTRTEVSGAF